MPVMVLASSSPSRLMVLRNAGVDPVVAPPDVDEDAALERMRGEGPAETVTALARAKSAAAADHARESAARAIGDADDDVVVVARDSMLLLDGELSGKPHTVDECVRRWGLQRGRDAELVTGHCVTWLPAGGGEPCTEAGAVRATVRFGEPSDADVRAYAESGEPLGCAGAFTLEALGGWFIDGVDGDPSNVLGLSLPFLRRTLAGWGLDVSAFWNTASGAARA
ncbi:Maf family protein [Corynebacterium sp. 335C]